MERVATLIYKLLDQYQNQVGAGKMMMTAQMLLTELQQFEQASVNGLSNKVTVVIPTVVQAAPEAVATIPAAAAPSPVSAQQPVQQKQSYQQFQQYQPAVAWQAPLQSVPIQPAPPPPAYATVPPASVAVQSPPAYAAAPPSSVAVQAPPAVAQQQPIPAYVAASVQPAPAPSFAAQPQPVQPATAPPPSALVQPAQQQYHTYMQHQQVQEQPPVEQPAIPSVPPAAVQNGKGWQFDPVHDVPTLTHQETNGSDVNSKAATGAESLNERLKVDKTELGSVLQESPIRDLKKAIGINDRYLFINELFRGDETMYERSLKTINGFNILPEAQYWIQRELKVKLGWNELSDTVSHFDQLVRRRFS